MSGRKAMSGRRAPLFFSLILALLSFSGCAALIDAGFRDLQDDGKHPRYEHKSYWGHFLDSLLEDEEDC